MSALSSVKKRAPAAPRNQNNSLGAPPAYDELFGSESTSTTSVPQPEIQQSSFRNPSAPGPDLLIQNESLQRSGSQRTNVHQGPLNTWNPVEVTVVVPSWQQELEEKELRMWFSTVDENNDGHITSEELRMALLNDNWTPFNMETIQMMLKMFDKNSNDRIEFVEFAGLKRYVEEWRNVFDQYDSDHSGTIDVNEIQQAFQGMGHVFSLNLCTTLCRRFSKRTTDQSINLDAFTYACAMVNAMSKDHARNPRTGPLEETLLRWLTTS